jgi:hypothetical protein
MKAILVLVLLVLSTTLATTTLFTQVPRRLVLGWLGIGTIQSIFLLVLGFEYLFLTNLLFVVSSATALQIYSALFGTRATHEAESMRNRKDWIYGIGAGATMAAILLFALFGTVSKGTHVLKLIFKI